MNKDPKKIITDVLKIIDYQNNREKFADEFIAVCIKKAFLEIINGMDKKITENLKNKLAGCNNIDAFIEIMKKYFNPPLLTRAIERNTTQIFYDYIEEILPALDKHRKNKLLEYLDNLYI